ncbi:hypothetical protein HFO56_33130 [Rhizobium laguerreae]|uniref:PcfJ domain-containing protein n=1 Tax=Rhizobium laguerreae TaxID=1076926 RepID=UPI001C9042A4|nr:PcfJ domain-containing protein [Rhizobium laguerreae]MBY3157169.1 hypothetical protein [Rhizobium laguerreae]
MSKTIHQQITDYVCGLDPDSRVQLLLTYCLGRLFVKEHGRGGDWKALAASVDGRHIADWLRAAVANGDPWLDNVDELARPKKLLKFGKVEQVTAEADKAMAKANQTKIAHVADGNDEFVMELGNGLYVVRLLTPEALDYESSIMQHCIGNGGYDAALESGERQFFSVRGVTGKPHVTIDIDTESGWVVDMKGKQNSPPDPAYVEALTAFFRSRPNLRFMRNTGLVFDQDRRLVHVRSLPDGTVIEGDLRIGGGDNLVLPTNLTVKGDVEITFIKKVTLPRTLTVGGTLMFEGCELAGKIENLTVNGWSAFFADITHTTPSFLGKVSVEHLGLSNTQTTELPELYVKSIAIEECPISDLSALAKHECLTLLRLTALPNIMEVPAIGTIGNLEFRELPIRDFHALPDAEEILFAKMEIGKLPENLSVSGTLTFANCKIEALPHGLTVGNIAFIETEAPEFTSDMIVIAAKQGRRPATF